MKVINIFGVPGAGKTTMSLGLCHALKESDVKVEFVDEYARRELLLNGPDALARQDFFAAELRWHLVRAKRAGVEVAVVDSPLLLCSFYATQYQSIPSAHWHQYILDAHKSFDNLNFWLSYPVGRTQTHDMSTRVHTSADSQSMESGLKTFLTKNEIALIHTTNREDMQRRVVEAVDGR
jgi:nicotinamide riboside kinase